MNRLYLLTLLILIGCGNHDQAKTSSGSPAKTDTTPSSNTPAKTNIPANPVDTPTTWVFNKVDSSRLLFTNGKTMETNLYDLEYVGQVPLIHKAPLMIFSGRDCHGCDEGLSIYMNSPSDSTLVVEAGENRYKWPGKQSDYFTNQPFYSSRAFYGQVLKDTMGVIWYEKRLVENGKWERDVFLSWMDHDTRRDTIFFTQGNINQTLALVKQGLCQEIKGRTYKSEP